MTISVSKQLLPVYSKPMIFYPLSTLLWAGVTSVLIISTPRDKEAFETLLGDGSRFGIEILYSTQSQPRGIADGILVAEEFIKAERRFALILGDNLFYGSGVGRSLSELEHGAGASVFAQLVSNPQEYGVVEFDQAGTVLSIEEKPMNPKSSYAIPGFYFYDESAPDRVRELKPSRRGELEISDLNLSYLRDNALRVVKLPRGTAWLDTGSVQSLSEANEYVRVVEGRQGTMISAPEEVAWRVGLISNDDLAKSSKLYADTPYGNYLKSLLSP
jgi:glucose-1-phosphate thymidylyltransferase